MKRRLQILGVCIAALLAIRMMAQDTGAGAGGAGAGTGAGAGGGGEAQGTTTSPDNSGAGAGEGTGNTTGGEGGNGNGSTNGNSNGGTNGELPAGGGDQGQGGAGSGGLMGPDTGLPGSGSPTLETPPGGGEIVPPPAPETPLPGGFSPVPGMTPAPSAESTGTAGGGGAQGASSSAPVTFTLPGGYGGSASQTFTLGEGRLSKPLVTFTFTTSQGYDDNLFNADSHIVATPTPTPGPTPALGHRLVEVVPPPPFPPFFVVQAIQPKAGATPTPPPSQGVIGSPVSTVTLGIQAQRGTPRTVFTTDLSIGALDYWDRPGDKIDYDGNFDLSMVHKLTPRATLSLGVNGVYQKTPDFSLLYANNNNNNNSGGAYLNGGIKADLSYIWNERITTVTSYSVNFNFGNNTGNDEYSITYGNQLRYMLSARNTITNDIREAQGIYPDNSQADNSSFYYLLGLDTYFSSKLHNTFSGGLEFESYKTGGGSRALPYIESATTFALRRGGGLTWTNRVGSEDTGNASQEAESYRTGLSLSQPLSTKLTSSLSLNYNYIGATGQGAYAENQFQTSFALGYNLSARLSLNLTYSFTDQGTTQLNSSYTRQQIYLGGTYTFR